MTIRRCRDCYQPLTTPRARCEKCAEKNRVRTQVLYRKKRLAGVRFLR